MEGNYNLLGSERAQFVDYTLERDGRELQPFSAIRPFFCNYTLERDGRELQQNNFLALYEVDYTLERDGRELQPKARICSAKRIIPLREMEGNYNLRFFI